MNISDRTISPNHPTFVIAEIGVNHDGSVSRALELVDLAAACGADAVKLQIFSATKLMHGTSQFAEYQQTRVNDANPVEMLKRYELSADGVKTVVAAIRKRGLIPLATPFSPSDVDVIAELGLPAVKIASPDLVNAMLLAKVVKLNVPVILSTGAATLDEVDRTCAWMRDWNRSFALLHCVSNYPVVNGDANLCWIGELAERCSGNAGYSDHTTDELTGAFAVSAGACIVEKHLTYNRQAAGPDHSASADPQQFDKYVRAIRLAETMRGKAGKRVLACEADVRRVSRQSVVIARELPSGSTIREEDLTVQRPGTGICASEIRHVIGRRVKQNLRAGDLLDWDMLAA